MPMAHKADESKKHSLSTRLVHGKSFSDAWNFSNHLVPPMTSNSTYRLESVERGSQGFQDFGNPPKDKTPIWIYDRLDEPSNLMLEEQLAYLEGADGAVTFASGMGAISATCLATLKSGDLILSDPTIYGCTFSLFTNWIPKFGIDIQWSSLDEVSVLDNPPENLRMIYLESVANPNLKISPLKKIAQRVAELNKERKPENKILIVVDNTFATPIGCSPLKLGADFVVHSLTKNIAGFGTELGGAVACKEEWMTPLRVVRKDFGAVLNSKSAWQILNYGIPTLKLRFEKQERNARNVARFLEKSEKVEKVIYPGLDSYPYKKNALESLNSDEEGTLRSGYMIAFLLKGSNEETVRFVDHLAEKSYCITLAVSLGLTKTLVEVPRLMTHSSYDDKASASGNIPQKLVRLSIGIESDADIINDLQSALDSI